MACDDLVSPKHDQAISRVVSVHLGSNGSSLSICHVLQPERFAASCIFSLMNSLFSIFFPSLLQSKPFPKMPGFCPHLRKTNKPTNKKLVLFKHETLTSSLQWLTCTQRHLKKKKMMKCKFSNTKKHCFSLDRKHAAVRWVFAKQEVLFFFFRSEKEPGQSYLPLDGQWCAGLNKQIWQLISHCLLSPPKQRPTMYPSAFLPYRVCLLILALLVDGNAIGGWQGQFLPSLWFYKLPSGAKGKKGNYMNGME